MNDLQAEIKRIAEELSISLPNDSGFMIEALTLKYIRELKEERDIDISTDACIAVLLNALKYGYLHSIMDEKRIRLNMLSSVIQGVSKVL